MSGLRLLCYVFGRGGYYFGVFVSFEICLYVEFRDLVKRVG